MPVVQIYFNEEEYREYLQEAKDAKTTIPKLLKSKLQGVK